MKKILFLLVLVPVLSWSQSKRKKRIAEEKANAVLVASLKSHVQYLADDQLEGRLTGSKGEELAMQYLVQQYQQMGIEAKGTNGYVQEFEIKEGKQVDAATRLVVEDQTLTIRKDYFPLPYSANKSAQGKPAIALTEKGQPWFFDLQDVLEDNQNNPHFDIENTIKQQAAHAVSKGATALFVYNSSNRVDNIQFNKNDTSALLSIPVIYITKEGIKKHFADESASYAISVNVSLSEKKRKARNVIAFLNNNAANTVIIGAHYDHLGYGEDKSALDTFHAVHNGADDNASGTAALLELARMLKVKAPTNNNYLFIHFSGEELGLLGSKYWLENPTVKITPNYMINMDMVGRYDTAHKLTVGGYGTSPVWGEVWKGLNSNLIIKFDSTGSGPSDHASFYRANIPVQFFFTGSHPDYHKISDDADKINYDAQKDIVKLIYELINRTDTKGKLSFTKTTEPQMGQTRRFTVSLGVIPDYGYSGTGMRIDGVSPGKLAEKLGLQAGDILLQLGEFKFVDVMSYMQALGKFNKGDKTQLRIKRGNEEKVFEVEL
ncbi:MAG: M28 family peptidase [Sediminibacterium sp. Gen4]|jgi:aminopeptidase YwaD|uniref:M28 family peptidase n=1 Tax=unclassified Sediminibacterium TaxID=2635961 RepID=UPI0015BBEE71|nr:MULTISPECIES: M28 family peptidase [unclassified Sediminibacterium]MBW0162106.1 M28 family peptidase [Sediminibacterium sp.]MBW0162956.1 M28 family peptidase [Sediminibacterium sp.]NWK66239.1 M28 family peptidase [Sediminibacterium sp. Gen4]